MKINRRSEKLDALLGKRVQIEFKDGDFCSGILKWNERYTPETPWKPQSYYLDLYRIVGSDYIGSKLFFRKGHVKNVMPIEEGK